MRRRLAWIALFCLAALFFWIASGWTGQAGVSDFAAYWTAGHELAAGRNPYDAGKALDLQRGIGFEGTAPLVMRNPPWAIPFVLPLGLLPYAVARRLWFVTSLVLVLVSVRCLWRIYAKPGRPDYMAWVVAGTFLPVATVLAIGQIGPLILLGIAGFLYFENKNQHGWAGACALLVALKPHLVFLFWPALLLWSMRQGRWRTLCTLTGGILLLTLVAILIDRPVIGQYFELWRSASLLRQTNPTPSGALGFAFSPRAGWIEFVSVFTAIAWFAVWWTRVGKQWYWRDQLPLLLLVSFVTTPYAWFFDQVVLLPAIFQVVAWVSDSGVRNWFRPAIVYASINVFTLYLILAHRTFFWYAWTSPAWLLVYLWQQRAESVRVGKMMPDP